MSARELPLVASDMGWHGMDAVPSSCFGAVVQCPPQLAPSHLVQALHAFTTPLRLQMLLSRSWRAACLFSTTETCGPSVMQ